MAAPRKHPPKDAATTIESLAAKGHSTIGVAKHFNVSRSTVKRWLEEDERLEDAYEMGRDSYRQMLEQEIVAMGLAGKNCGGLIFLMKAKFGLFDMPQSGTKVDVAVNNQPTQVLVVRDHGTDEEWASKCAEQQRKLIQDAQGCLPVPQNAPETRSEPIREAYPLPAPIVAPAGIASAPMWKGRA